MPEGIINQTGENIMIIPLSATQGELAVSIVEPGCSGGKILDHSIFRLVIRRPENADCRMAFSPIIRKGCWPGMPEWIDPSLRVDIPTLVYPAFTTDEDGNIVFKFDSKLRQLLPGRYWGCVEKQTASGWVGIRTLDIDLETTVALVERVIVSDSEIIPTNC